MSKLRSVGGRLDKVNALEDQKKWEEALIIYNNLVADYSTHAKEFSSRAHRLLLKRKFKAAVQTSVIGGTIHPADFLLRLQRTTFYFIGLKWGKLLDVWREKDHYHEQHINLILARFECLKQLGKEKDAEEALISGHHLYQENPKLNLVVGKHFFVKEQWDRVPFFYKKAMAYGQILKTKEYVELATAELNKGNVEAANEAVLSGLTLYPNDKDLLLMAIEFAKEKQEWKDVIEQCSKAESVLRGEANYNDVLLMRSIALQFSGMHKEAKDCFNLFMKNNQAGNERHKKYILFDNGESRIEFYKHLGETNDIILTFDSINLTWHTNPFGYKLLEKQNIDILSLRRRKVELCHQDLSADKYYKMVEKLVSGYEKKFAYGFSLGGYTSLYYASALKCDILALSPRLSAHPIFGKGKYPKELFTHGLNFPYNEEISPVIVYDPKDRRDNRFIEENIKPAFPHARYIKTDYSGHATAPYLLKIGMLKTYVYCLLNGTDYPSLKRENNYLSPNYLRILASHCYRRGKLNWAIVLVERALAIDPNNKHGLKLRENIKEKIKQENKVLLPV